MLCFRFSIAVPLLTYVCTDREDEKLYIYGTWCLTWTRVGSCVALLADILVGAVAQVHDYPGGRMGQLVLIGAESLCLRVKEYAE